MEGPVYWKCQELLKKYALVEKREVNKIYCFLSTDEKILWVTMLSLAGHLYSNPLSTEVSYDQFVATGQSLMKAYQNIAYPITKSLNIGD